MKKVNRLFKIFIPALLAATLLALVFAILAVVLTYSHSTGNIEMMSPLSIFFVVTLLIALIVPVVFAILFKELKITRTKRDLIVVKIAALFLCISIIAFEIVDMIYMSNTEFLIWRFLRLIVSFFFIAHTIFAILPSKTNIVPFARHCASAGAPIFAILSVLSFYFPGDSEEHFPDYLKILFVIAYSLFALYALYDFKWKLVPTNPRSYMALSSMTFVFTSIVSITSIVAIFANEGMVASNRFILCIFEAILLLAFSFIALSKTLAIKKTVAHVVKVSEEHEAEKPSDKKKK